MTCAFIASARRCRSSRATAPVRARRCSATSPQPRQVSMMAIIALFMIAKRSIPRSSQISTQREKAACAESILPCA